MEAVKQGSAAVGLKVGACTSVASKAAPVSPLAHLIDRCKLSQRREPESVLEIQSDTHVVLATLNRASSELSSHQRKTFKVDDHLGIAMSGIISDGRSLCRYMRNECLNHRCCRCLSLMSSAANGN